jgi:hypothetical protein
MSATLNTQFITGLAGSGKSTALQAMLALDENAFMLTSTTGISSINLGVATLNSTLKFYDTDSLMDSYVSGRLYNIVKRLLTGPTAVRGLAIDEVSMMDADQLDMIYDTFVKVCKSPDIDGEIDLILTGDFAQLPPVKARFAFEARCWPEFEKNMVKLDKVWRQDNPLFLEALNKFRIGNGRDGVELLKKCGVKFYPQLCKFNGTTIVPVNDGVDNYNKVQFNEISAPIIYVPTKRQGLQVSEWKDPKIPDVLELKIGSLVMILANDITYKSYANGDQGIVSAYDSVNEQFQIKLLSSSPERDGKVVVVGYITRVYKDFTRNQMTGELNKAKEVVGSVTYMPLRLGYGSTAHKSQGLTLDKVQIDFRHRFFSNPGSMYVALSRCRTPEGLRLVGSEEMMIRRTVVNKKVERFL